MLGRLAVGVVLITVSVSASGSLAAAAPTQKQLCAAAQELRGLGRDSDAQALYLGLVKAGVRCPGTTAALHPGWMQRIESWVSSWATFAGKTAGFGLFAALIAGVLLSPLSWPRRVRSWFRAVRVPGFKPRVAVGAFDDSGFSPPGFGKATSALVEGALRRLSGPSLTSEVHVNVATGAESASATVAKLGDLAPQFKALAGIMSVLGRTIAFPRYQLSGTLQPKGEEGFGLTLALDRGSRSVDTTTLWHASSDADRAATFQLLATLAAAWVDYAVRKDEAPGELEFATSPKSYAYFRAGVLFSLFGLQDAAVSAYEDALRIDGSNIGALANLGRIRGLKRDDAGAETLLRAALNGLDGVPKKTKKTGERRYIWYQVGYNLAAHGANRGLPTGRDDVWRLVWTAGGTLDALGNHSGRRLRYPARARRLARFLHENLEPAALIVFAHQVEFENCGPSGEAVPRRPRLARKGSRAALAALLCEAQFAADPEERAAAARRLVQTFVLERKRLAYRAKYNVACYLAVHADVEGAFKWLREALADAPLLEQVRLAVFARRDPFLKSLQGPRFAEIIAPYIAQPGVVAWLAKQETKPSPKP